MEDVYDGSSTDDNTDSTSVDSEMDEVSGRTIVEQFPSLFSSVKS